MHEDEFYGPRLRDLIGFWEPITEDDSHISTDRLLRILRDRLEGRKAS